MRIPEQERRLLQWGRWWNMRTSGSIGFATTTLRDRVDNDGYDAAAIIPTNDGEAALTEQAVQSLNADLQATLRMVYVTPRGAKENARRLGVSPATVTERVDRAHRLLASWYTEEARAAREEEARVQQLQRLAAFDKPGGFPH